MAELMDLASSVLTLATSGEDLEVYGVHTVATTVQAGDDAVIRRVDSAETRGLGVRVFRDERVGYASTSDLAPDAIAASVDRARANARASDPDPASRPPDAQPAHDRSDAPLLAASTSLEAKITLVTRLVNAVSALDPRVRGIDTAEYADERREVVVVSTRGVRAQHERCRCELWVDALGEHPAGMATDTGYWSGLDAADADPEAVARDAVTRTVHLLGEPRPRTDGLPVLLDYVVVGELLAAVGRACTGGAIGSGRSPFAGRLGEPVGSEAVSLVDDGARFAGPHDDEGTGRRPTRLISSGVLTGVLHSAATASAMGDGSTSTGNARRVTYKSAPRAAPAGLLLEPTTGPGQLVADVGDAVYLQQLSGAGSGINPVTGRIDVGGVGWLLRDGEAAGRVATFSLTTDFGSLLRSVTHVADDARHVQDLPVRAGTVGCHPLLLD
jgi:PmbA protein